MITVYLPRSWVRELDSRFLAECVDGVMNAYDEFRGLEVKIETANPKYHVSDYVTVEGTDSNKYLAGMIDGWVSAKRDWGSSAK